MRLLAAFVVLCAVAQVSAQPVNPKRPEPGVCLHGRVVKIVDGDTVDISVQYTIRVRLLDCWAPESRTKDHDEKMRGIESKNHLHSKAFLKECDVRIPLGEKLSDSLTLDRVLGHVWVDGEEKDLSTIQVEAGHAKREKQ